MSEQLEKADNKPRFFHLTLEGEDVGVSPELRGVVSEFVQQMVEEYDQRKQGVYNLLKAYPDDKGLQEMWTPEKIEEFANRSDTPNAVEKLRNTVFHQVKWDDVMAAHQEDPEQALLCLRAIYDRAGAYVNGGLYASQALDLNLPFEKGQFSFIRLSFIEDWQPRGGIEASMVDMLAQCYVAWQYWLTRSFQTANNQDTVKEQRIKNKKSERQRWDEGDWQTPRLTAVEYLDHCTQMADRFNRMYLRVLRQMRDLRRYSVPVTINNPKQVNIAAEGGQQVNLQQRKKHKQKRSSVKTQRLIKSEPGNDEAGQ
jgi:hypothetical protein